MFFNSFIFLIFLSIVVPVYYKLPNKYKNVFLLVCSYFFYGYWDWRFCSLLLISTTVDFFTGKAIYKAQDPKKRKGFLLISLMANLGILGFFKYYNFFIDSFISMTSFWGFNLDLLHINVILPVGISFYTFQTLSYTIDVYRGNLKPTHSFINFAVFVSFFPQLVAGPIERAVNLLPQIEAHTTFSKKNFSEGLTLISLGMFKKVLIGDTCGRIVDHIFASPQYYSSIELIMGLILFSIQIYTDFSGYSKIARGTAKMLGYDLMINFKQPYLSSNITEFWRRWHISLSSWLRDYLYISLGGNRKGKIRTYINLMLTMLLGGLWHGANWTFVVWGGLHGISLAIHKMVLKGRKPNTRFIFTTIPNFIKFIFKLILTNLFVLITWLFFRSESFSEAFFFASRIIYWTPSDVTARVITIILTYLFVTLILDIIEYKTQDQVFLLKIKSSYRYSIITSMWFFTLIYLFQAEKLPFVYFQF
jgi:alginate O-acetyltransferase complex protein AlgI